MQLSLETFAVDPFAERVWESTYHHELRCLYVALAEVLQFPLATLDSKLSKAIGPKCAFMTPTQGD